MPYYKNKRLNDITTEVVNLMPPLQAFFESDNNIEHYSEHLFNYQATDTYLKRQEKFIELINSKINRLFNNQEKEDIKLNLNKNTGLKGGVVDHHGILNHPVLCGVNITPHYFRMFNREQNGDILTFATGNVPINDFFHRRGFMINDVKVNIFKKTDKNTMVYNFPVHDFAFVKSLKETHQWKEHNDKSKQTLAEVQEIINNIDFSTCHTLGDQLTKINFHLWKLLFAQDIRDNTANLISLEYDDIVMDYLIWVINTDKDSFVYNMLFNESKRSITLQEFEGETGAWDQKRNLGTMFFWGRSSEGLRLRMSLENNYLVSEDNQLKIKWDEESITVAMQSKQLLPGMFLKFSLILFYMGLKPLAGYGSANYLFNLQQKIIKFLQNDYPADVKNIKTITTNNVTSIPVLLKRKDDGKLDNYFAFDIIGDGGLEQKYFDKINQLPIKDFMAPNLQVMYDYAFNLYGKGRKTDYQITSKDFADLYKDIL